MSTEVTKEAFGEKPANVANGDKAVMLFDHALLATTDGAEGDIQFTVGNLMALSAPGKGLKKNTTENPSELAKNVNDHGQKLTQEFINIVKTILKYERPKEIEDKKITDIEKLNEDIKKIQKEWKTYVTDDFEKKLKNALIAPGGDNSEEDSLITKVWKNIADKKDLFGNNESEEKLKNKIFKQISNKYHALQALGHNAIWDAQNLGGFKLPKGSPYIPLQSEQLGENGEVPTTTVEDFVIKSIPPEGILFLCESALLFGDKGKGIMVEKNKVKHLPVYKDKKKYEKVYSASWINPDVTVKADNKKLATGDVKKEDITDEDYCVFSVEKKGTNTKTLVVVVHVNDKVAKKGKTDKWNEFLKNCYNNNISYVAGDTNVTKSKTGSSTSDYVPFAGGDYVTERSITNFNIKKGRVPGNIWANNQIYKFEDTIEPDGMVILKLKGKVEFETTAPPLKNTAANNEEEGGGGGRKRRRKRTKKRRKSRKTKRKRKRKRTKKRKRKRRKGTKKRR